MVAYKILCSTLIGAVVVSAAAIPCELPRRLFPAYHFTSGRIKWKTSLTSCFGSSCGEGLDT